VNALEQDFYATVIVNAPLVQTDLEMKKSSFKKKSKSK